LTSQPTKLSKPIDRPLPRPLGQSLADAAAKRRELAPCHALLDPPELLGARNDGSPSTARIEDLHPIVRDHVYHPEFGWGFGLKSVLPALCSGLGYDDLEIQDGDIASTSLDALLLDTAACSDANRQALRNALLRYCEQYTLAMVRVHEQLAAMAAAPAARGVDFGQRRAGPLRG
jgi:hypothetical protein